MMLERQRPRHRGGESGGEVQGQEATAMNQRAKIRAMDAEGVTRTAIAEKLRISERSVYRALAG